MVIISIMIELGNVTRDFSRPDVVVNASVAVGAAVFGRAVVGIAVVGAAVIGATVVGIRVVMIQLFRYSRAINRIKQVFP